MAEQPLPPRPSRPPTHAAPQRPTRPAPGVQAYQQRAQDQPEAVDAAAPTSSAPAPHPKFPTRVVPPPPGSSAKPVRPPPRPAGGPASPSTTVPPIPSRQPGSSGYALSSSSPLPTADDTSDDSVADSPSSPSPSPSSPTLHTAIEATPTEPRAQSPSAAVGRQSVLQPPQPQQQPTTRKSGSALSLSSPGERRSGYNSSDDASEFSPGTPSNVRGRTETTERIEARKNNSFYSMGVSAFNAPDGSTKKAIAALIDNQVIGSTALDVAQFLMDCAELEKKAIGDYLGERDDFAVQVLNDYVKLLDFSGLEMDTALRRLLYCFLLPGESQKIERIMETFAGQYFAQNPEGVFADEDAVFVLAYSIIMLNTDAHNPQVKNKMTLDQFVSNNRGINAGADLPRDFLSDIYTRIVNDEIRMKGDDTFPNALKKGWLVNETKGMLGMKNRTRRWIVFNSDLRLYQFRHPKEESGSPLASWNLSNGICIERRQAGDSDEAAEPAATSESMLERVSSVADFRDTKNASSSSPLSSSSPSTSALSSSSSSSSSSSEVTFILYDTTTPDDCSAAVISNAWRLVAPDARTAESWILTFEKNLHVVFTASTPTVGVQMDPDETEVQSKFETTRACRTQYNVVHRTLNRAKHALNVSTTELYKVSQSLDQLHKSPKTLLMQKHKSQGSSMLSERSSVDPDEYGGSSATAAAAATAPSDAPAENLERLEQLVECLGAANQLVHSFVNLMNQLRDDIERSVEDPLSNITRGDLAASKTQVEIFTKVKQASRDAADKLQREIREQSKHNAADAGRFQRAYKEHQESEELLNLHRTRTIDILDQSNRESDWQMIRSMSSLVTAYHQFFEEGVKLTTGLLPVTERLRSFVVEDVDRAVLSKVVPYQGAEPIDKLHIKNTSVVFEGQLHKKGGKRRNWSSRYFVLKPLILYYFANYGTRNPVLKGYIPLRNVTIDSCDSRKSFAFAIACLDRVWFMAAPTEKAKNTWIQMLRSCVSNDPSYQLRRIESDDDYTIALSAQVDIDSMKKQKLLVQNKRKELAKNRLHGMGTSSLGVRSSIAPTSPMHRRDNSGGQAFPGIAVKKVLADEELVLKSGSLFKQGGTVKNWKQRFFELTANKLCYYVGSDQILRTLKGAIQLDPQSSMVSYSAGARAHGFQIQTVARTYYMAAGSDTERTDWVNAIQSCLSRGKDFSGLVQGVRESTVFGLVAKEVEATSKRRLERTDSGNRLAVEASSPAAALAAASSSPRKKPDADQPSALAIASPPSPGSPLLSSSPAAAPAPALPDRPSSTSTPSSLSLLPRQLGAATPPPPPLPSPPPVQQQTPAVDEQPDSPTPTSPPTPTPTPTSDNGGELLLGVGSEALKVGFLVKKGGLRKNWTTRWFVLKPKSLTYYRTSTDPEPKGVIHIGQGCTVEPSNIKGNPGFKIQGSSSDRVYVCQASDETDRNSWVALIKDVIAKG